MRKLLLCFSLLFCTLFAVAQNNTNGLVWEMTQPADNTVTLSWQYASADVNTSFQIYRTDVVSGVESTPLLLREVKAAKVIGHEPDAEGNEVPTMGVLPDSTWVASIYGLDLTGTTGYKFAIKVLNKTEEFTEPVYLAGDDANTAHKFTYGLSWPDDESVFTNEKSSSVTLNWNRHPQDDGTFVYTVYGIEHNVVLGTTTENNYLLTNLEPEVEHIFMVRAYKDGKYMATTPSSKAYTPKRVDCITFTSASAKNNTVTLNILGYGGDGSPFSTDKSAYDLVHNGDRVPCRSIDQNEVLTFTFDKVDVNQEFKLITKKIEGEKKVDAIGLFTLNTNGTAIENQTCDIVYDLKVTHVTQHTVTFTWTDPGFEADKAILEYTPNGGETKSIEVPNPKVYTYSLGGLEHSTDYTFVLKLSDDYKNQAKATVKATTKVGSICGMDSIQSGSASLGCGKGKFLMPYNLEFYTAYRDDAKKDPYVVIRFKPDGTQQINDVKIYATTERGNIADLANLTSKSMTKGADGWYSCELHEYGLLWWKSDITNDMNIRFAVSVKHNDGCRGNLFGLDNNTYITKFASYKVSTGCQDDEIFSVIKFTKTYEAQSELTLQTNGRVASLGVFTKEGYISDTKFDLNERVFYNSFDDAPSKFTLDISDYEVGTYYMHIHDVYGEAGALKYLWAIY